MLKKVLFIKYDKIGDFVLTWPALYLLKTALPNSSIEVLVSAAVKPLAETCPFIDHVIIDSGNDQATSEQLAARQYDAILVSSSELRTYKMLRELNVVYKLAPKFKWYQYLYKHRANVQYQKDEGCWRGNCLLVEHFLTYHGYTIPKLPKKYWDMATVRQKWQAYYGHQDGEKLIFVHPGTGGSSGGVAPLDFANLLINIDRLTQVDCKFILTYSGSELLLAQEIFDNLSSTSTKIIMAKPLENLADFAQSIVAADMFIAGSTGPLHIAGLHDIPTVGFYAGRRSAAQVRWQTLTQSHKRLSFTPPVGKRTGRNMSLIDFNNVATKVSAFLDLYYTDK